MFILAEFFGHVLVSLFW